jgi:nickel/cobalt transporter (NicO) family protein
MLESALSLGLILGLRHASDADHVCAIALLLRSEQGFWAAVRTALLWSLGHSLTFFAVGAVLVSGRFSVPGSWEPVMELLVATLLVTLGAVQWRHAQCAMPASPPPARPYSWRVVLVGIVHGLAGSAGIALLALATVHERLNAFLFLLLFGLGVAGGMVLLTILLSLPLGFVVRNSERWRARILKTASVLTIGLGVWMGLSGAAAFGS